MKSEETAELEAYVPGTDELAEYEGRITVLSGGDPWVRPREKAVGMSLDSSKGWEWSAARSNTSRVLCGHTRSDVPYPDGSCGHLAAAICVAATATSGVGRRRRSVTVVDVVLQNFDDCPNWRVVDEHLRSLADEFADMTVTHRLVDTPEEADRVGFRGSPTVLVNGVDPFATEVDPVGGLSCRMYPTPDGPAGSPTLEQLRRALGART